jgi:hypothetical protein
MGLLSIQRVNFLLMTDLVLYNVLLAPVTRLAACEVRIATTTWDLAVGLAIQNQTQTTT